jgi:type IV secretion system protein VirB1
MLEGCLLQNVMGDIPMAVMRAVVTVESGHNPYAIGVVGDRLVRQPKSLGEAVATANRLESIGKNYSVGLAQLNRSNFSRYSVADVADAFDKCTNLQLGARVLVDCYARSGSNLGKALSCYYSGNFETGFKHGYVQRVMAVLERSKRDDKSPPVAADTNVSRSKDGGADIAQLFLQNVMGSPVQGRDAAARSPAFEPAERSAGVVRGKAIPSARDGAFVF